jgi:hypothetical protein
MLYWVSLDCFISFSPRDIGDICLKHKWLEIEILINCLILAHSVVKQKFMKEICVF